MAELTDSDYMPHGKYKGKVQMANLDAEYLIWLKDNDRASPRVAQYIRENEEALREEIMSSRR